MTNFYVYEYTDPFSNKVIYVGKGCELRAYKHLKKSHNKTLAGRLAQLKQNDVEPIITIYECPDEEFAFFLESELIRKYGRVDLNTGSLFNHTNGGEGVSGRIVSEETKRKIGVASSKRKHTEDTKIKLRGIRSDETKLKMSEAKLGKSRKPFSKETLEKMKKPKNVRTTTCPHCLKTGGASNMSRYHFNNCKDKK